MGSLTVDAEVDDCDIVDHLIENPRLITRALQELAKPNDRRGRKPETCVRFAAALRAIGGDSTAIVDNSYAGFAEWADAFAQFDCIDRERAMGELERVAPLYMRDLAGAV